MKPEKLIHQTVNRSQMVTAYNEAPAQTRMNSTTMGVHWSKKMIGYPKSLLWILFLFFIREGVPKEVLSSWVPQEIYPMM
jgi:hypothetical protein